MSSEGIIIVLPDPAWEQVCEIWKTHLPDYSYPDQEDLEGLSKAAKARKLFEGHEIIKENGDLHCKKCQYISAYLIFQYVGSSPELMVHQQFKNVCTRKALQFTNQRGVFYGHLIGLEQESKTLLSDLLERPCSCN